MSTFTEDWTVQIRDTWPEHVLPHVDSSSELHWLEIGSFEGRSALWIVENVLQHPSSSLTCVDEWKVWPFHGGKVDFDYESVFDCNTLGISKIAKRKGRSEEVLPTLRPASFDGAYVDGNHDEIDVLQDARMALRLMKAGGLMVFDDYEWPRGSGVKRAMSKFLDEVGPRLEKLHCGYQLVVKVLF